MLGLTSDIDGLRTGLAVGDAIEGITLAVSPDCVVKVASVPVSCAAPSSVSRCRVLGRAMLGSAMLGNAILGKAMLGRDKDTGVGSEGVPPEREVPAIVGV